MTPSAESRRAPGHGTFAAVLLLAYAGLVVWNAAHHAMWRDEIQAWLLVRDSADLAALLHNMRYEGHPVLWHLVIWPLARFGRDPGLMQIPNVAFAVAAVALVLWRAPLDRREMVLFPFGFFVFFEYAGKSRSYALGMMLTFAACALWPGRREHPVRLAAVLALLANAHLLFAIVSGAFAAAVLVDRIGSRGWERPGRWEVIAAVLLAAGWAVAVAAAWPAADAVHGRAALGLGPDRLISEIGAIAGLIGPYDSLASTLIGLALLTATFVVIRREPAAVTLLALVTGLVFMLFLLAYVSNVWHRGVLFLAVFAALWIARLSPAAAPQARGPVGRLVLVTLLAAQLASALWALWIEAGRPLSAGRAVARHIAAQGWAGDPLVGSPDYAVSTVVGYLGIPRAYYGNVGRWGSFTLWDRAREQVRDAAAMLEAADGLPRPTTLVTTEPIGAALAGRYGYREIARFDGASNPTERYVLYRRD